MKPKVLRHLIIALLTVSGVFQLLLAMLGGEGGEPFGVLSEFLAADRLHRRRHHARGIADCNANGLFANIEAEQRARCAKTCGLLFKSFSHGLMLH